MSSWTSSLLAFLYLTPIKHYFRPWAHRPFSFGVPIENWRTDDAFAKLSKDTIETPGNVIAGWLLDHEVPVRTGVEVGEANLLHSQDRSGKSITTPAKSSGI
jgi:hypothetical protein